MRRSWKRGLWIGGLLLLAIVGTAVAYIGPRFLLGILRYDSRHEGTLRPGDRAPDVELWALDGRSRVRLLDGAGGRPRVLIFGSFT
jgi:hypothetical protein